MKDKTVTVRVPDFCPEDCPAFSIKENADETYSCEHEGNCKIIYSGLKKEQAER